MLGCPGRQQGTERVAGGAAAATGALQLHTAFSRAGEPCASGVWRGARVNVSYVQDLIEERAAELSELLGLPIFSA